MIAVEGLAHVVEGAFVELPGDEPRLRQALLNLVRNAAESVRGTGKPAQVTICGTMEELAGRKWQRICVVDNGPGIPPDVLPRIFDPFFTTKDVGEGSGLGLSIVHGIVERHGGHIEVQSAAGQGTTFRLTFPRASSATVAAT